MEWFFTLNDNPVFFELAKVAVITAKRNTQLQPICMYSGNDSEIMKWLDKYGVKTIRHRASLEEFAVNLYQNNKMGKSPQEIAAFFIRVDMPLYCSDETFLYTDVDVMFLGDCVEIGKEINPKIIAAAPQENPWEFEEYFNNGIMVLNGKAMKDTYADFLKFIQENQSADWLFEQDSYNKFYRNVVEFLPLEYNWKSYWEKDRAFWYNGVAPRQGPIQILHFHGPKPFYKGGGYSKYLNKWFTSFKDYWYEIYQSEFSSLPIV